VPIAIKHQVRRLEALAQQNTREQPPPPLLVLSQRVFVMSVEEREEASQLRSRAATARRLAVQVTDQADREKLLLFAAELEARAAKLERGGRTGGSAPDPPKRRTSE
jgi:hypothetical protein